VRDTTRLRQLDAVRTINPIFLPLAGAGPELSWKHQVSLIDNRNITNIPVGQSTDRGVVQIQNADGAGNPVGDWVNLEAFENDRDQQGTDNFANCTFDPVDDGNNEDVFFDPSDPLRRLGPSSTCFPEFSFARAGHTDWRLDFNPANIGLAGDGPGLQGNQGGGFRNPGTWVSPKVNLTGFAGRAVRIRFLATSIELAGSQLWDNLFAVDNVVGDDGWFIDDIHIDQAVSSAITLSVDNAVFTGLACGACSLVTPQLTSVPDGTLGDPLDGPGQIVTLDASTSTIDVCNNGIPQYQWWIDTNLNDIVGDAGDTLLRDWTDNATFLDAPQVTTDYGVKVRCSTATSCDTGPGDNPSNATKKRIHVNCPASGNAKGPFSQAITVNKVNTATIEPDSNATVNWTAPASFDLIRGDLIALRASSGNYNGPVAACVANNGNANSVAEATSPGAAGTGIFYLVRPLAAQFCNQTPGYTTNHPKETAGRDAEIVLDPQACP
jgi:hypothetical protein